MLSDLCTSIVSISRRGGEEEITTLFDSDPGKLPTPFLSIIFCALIQEPLRYSGRPESGNCPIFLAHALSPKEELSLVPSVEDPGDVIVDDIHVEVTLGSTTHRLDPLPSELETSFTSLALVLRSGTSSHLKLSSSSLENISIVS